jgi:hypothetical protein
MKERETGVGIVAEDRSGPWLWWSSRRNPFVDALFGFDPPRNTGILRKYQLVSEFGA